MSTETDDSGTDSAGFSLGGNRATAYLGFLVVLALIAFSELGFSNLNTLLTDLEATAADFGLSVGAERLRLAVLIILDGVAGTGAVISLVGFYRRDGTWFRRGLYLTLGGFLTYGLYQVGSAWVQLADEYTVPVTIAGIVYALFGLFAYLGGQSFLDGDDLTV